MKFAPRRSSRRLSSRFSLLLYQLTRRFNPASPSTPLGSLPQTMAPSSIRSANPRRISQATLLIVTLILIAIAEFTIPGGLTPRRVKQQLLDKRVDEKLDIISDTDPDVVIDGGPLPIEAVHRKALVHRGSWMFALDSHLRLLLTWRAPEIKTCPMTWAPVGEHAVANETFEDAAKRGLTEEAGFIPRPRVYAIGKPFMYEYVYNEGTEDERTDKQWTQAYVVLPRGDALDFRTLADRDAQVGQQFGAGENVRYQGMSLVDVVRHAIQRPEYFCHKTQVTWMLKVLPLVVRVIQSKDQRLWRGYLRDEWEKLIESGSPVCCESEEKDLSEAEVNVTRCGVPCESAPEEVAVDENAR